VALALLAFAPAVAADKDTADKQNAAPQADTIFPDPAIHRGVLPNGLRYAIMRNATPRGGIALRLGMDVGTFDERDGEHGVAHFVEHMAFNAGDNAHEEGPEKAFAAAGVAFGRDQNAETGIFNTIYRLDLPHGDSASLDLAFHWLHDVVSQSDFAKAAIDRERGIILAERDARRDPDLRAFEALERFLAPGFGSTRPDSIGTPAELRAITPERVQAFYKRWYRPENALLVVVGDAPADAIEQRIAQSFGAWHGTGEAPLKRSFSAIDDNRGLAVQVLTEPHLPTELNVCRVRPPRHADDVAQLRKTTLTSLWVAILNTRLANLAKSSTPPFLNAEVVKSDVAREFEEICVTAAPLDENWQMALATVKAELSRLETAEPAQDELDTAIDTLRAGYRGGMQTAGTRVSADLATAILEKDLRADVVASPIEAFRAFDTAVEGVTAKDIVAAFHSDWSGGGPFLSLVAPNPPAGGAMREAWAKSVAPSLPSTSVAPGAVAANWAYADFGAAGHVVKREVFQAPDFVRVTFSNGVVLNFKHTDFEQGGAKVRIRFGAGRREIANKDYVPATIGANFFKIGGVGRQDYRDIEQSFVGWSWDAALEVRDSSFTLQGDTTAGGLKNQMQILAAYVSDPGFRSALDARLPSMINSFYRQYRASPALVLGTAVAQAVQPGNPLGMPPLAVLERLRMSDFKRIFGPALGAAPLEVTVVGDVDEATATELVAETFGAFAVRSGPAKEHPDTFFLHFPDGELPTVRVTHEGPQDQAMFDVLWPLYVAVPERRREEVSLMVLSHIFDDALRHRVRQELGKSYAPTVDLFTPDHADQGYMHAVVETAPRDVDQLVSETRHVAQRLAEGDFTDDDVEAARKPLLADLTARQSSNDWWLAGLSGSSTTHDGLDEMRDLKGLVAAVSASEIRKAAATWLARRPLVVIALPETRPEASAPSATPPATSVTSSATHP
jgi:zinc protease